VTSEKPLVSIVIPAFNHAGFLDSAIQSVLNQDYSAIELIVIDDGSTDNTREVLASYGAAFHWESQENSGQACTLNKGWAMAKGEILSYLSADDRLLPRAVSNSVGCLDENQDAVLSYCDFNLIDQNSRIIRRVRAPEYSYFDMVVKTVCAPGPGVFFRRSGFEKAGGWNPDFRQMPDFDFWIRLGLYGRFVHINEVLAEFRSHATSQTFAATPEQRTDEPIKILEGYFGKTSSPPEDVLSARKAAIANAHLVSAQLHFRAGRYRRGLDRLHSALSLHWRISLQFRFYRVCLHGLLSRPFYLFWQKFRGAWPRTAKPRRV